MQLIIFAISIGVIYSLIALSVLFSFRILGFPDLTPDGSFLVGASVGGIILSSTNSIILSLLLSFLTGVFFGGLTAFLHNKLRISKLLAGILTMTLLYSVSLRVLGTSNLSLINIRTIWISDYSVESQYANLLILIAIVIIVFLVLLGFLQTRIGLHLRALGDSEEAAQNINLNIKKLNVIGLGISNGIAGVSGCIISQYQGFVDISMGTGLVIISLAAIIIGETILKPKKITTLLLSAILGMIIYQAIITIALRIGLPTTDMKIATVILTILFIFFERIRKDYGAVNQQIGNRNI